MSMTLSFSPEQAAYAVMRSNPQFIRLGELRDALVDCFRAGARDVIAVACHGRRNWYVGANAARGYLLSNYPPDRCPVCECPGNRCPTLTFYSAADVDAVLG